MPSLSLTSLVFESKSLGEPGACCLCYSSWPSGYPLLRFVCAPSVRATATALLHPIFTCMPGIRTLILVLVLQTLHSPSIYLPKPSEQLFKPGIVVHVFNPSSQEAEAGRSLSPRPAWTTKLVLEQPRATQRNTILNK